MVYTPQIKEENGGKNQIAKVKAGETISLVDLAETVKADKERGKAAKTEKKPSIRAQLKAAKEQTPKKQAKQKTQDLERS
mgnify:CR=1 FL=1